MFVDSHCHLDFDGLAEDQDGVLTRARDAGVATMLTICTKLSQFDRVRKIAESYDNVWCSVGIHPHNAASERETSAEDLVTLAQHARVVGIGETGLDYYYDHAPHDVQARAFREHIKAARQTGLPLIVHSRDADDDMAKILTEEMGQGAYPGVMHCFSSSPALARTALDLGLYLSLSGIITFKTADELRAIVADAPLDRLLIETDAPYLAPVPHRGRTNEPSFVVNTAAKLAEIKGCTLDEIASATTANFFKLFAKVDQSPAKDAP